MSNEDIMNSEVVIPIWSRGVNFKAYRLDKAVVYEALMEAINHYRGDYGNTIAGWIGTDSCYVTEDKTQACIVYITFKRNTNSSTLMHQEILTFDPIACIFDFPDNLIFASTASTSKLATVVERRAFRAVEHVSGWSGIIYNGDFLYGSHICYMRTTEIYLTSRLKTCQLLRL